MKQIEKEINKKNKNKEGEKVVNKETMK